MTSLPPPPANDAPEPTDPAMPEAAGDETLRTQHLDLDALSAYLDGALEPGEILLSAGSSSEDRLEALSVEITGTRRVVPEGRVLTTPATVSGA